MSSITVYKLTSGEITKLVTCPESMVELQIEGIDGAGYIHGKFNTDVFYVDTLEKVALKKPERPSPHHDFDYTTKQWQPNPDAAWQAAKMKRSQLLTASDWVVTKATESGLPVPQPWMDYRQALRDITLQTDPWAIVWPVAP